MLKAPSKEVLRAIVNLKDTDDFDTLVAYLVSGRNETMAGVVYSKGEDLYRIQGAAQVMIELTKTIDSALETLESLKPKK